MVFLSLLSILFAFVYYLLGAGPFWGAWEDAFMLARYADNLIHGSGLIWNPGGPPTYGLTSVFYVGPVALVQSVLPGRPVLTLPLTSFLCGCLFVILIGILLRPLLRGSPAAKAAFGFLLVVTFARASIGISAHFWSGMDTIFDLSMMTGYLLIARWQERSGGWTATIVMGLAGGLMYGVRPDLLIYTFLVPAFLILLGKDKAAKVKGFVGLAITAVSTAAVLFAAYLYFGTALPLSFYAKALKLYGDFEYERYRKIPFEQLADYLSSYLLLFAVIFVDLMDRMESRSKSRRSPLDLALLCGTVLFGIYYLFFVLQIMEFNSRFYYPTLPAILWLAAVSTKRLGEKYSGKFGEIFQNGTGWGWATALIALGAMLIGPALVVNTHHVLRVAGQGFIKFDQQAEYRAYWQDLWFRLDRFSALPRDLTMATTEIGHVAAMNPGRIVVDMAGLNESQFARHPFSSAVLFSKYSPDLIYMPHPGYRSMNRDLKENPRFQQDYEYFPASALGPSVKMGIALRRDSKYYREMRAIVTASQ